MRSLFFILFSLFFSGVAAQTDTLTVRIKGMRCDECAHKVMTVVHQLPGIDAVRSNIERRTTTIVFNPTLTSADSIQARLEATGRYKATAYDPQEVIRRGFGLRIDDMHCQKCADRIAKRLQTVEGVDSMAPHLDKHYFFIRYDANRTCKDTIRKALTTLGYTPVNYYSGTKVDYAYYNIPREQATTESADEVLVLDGVEDVCVNPRGAMAVTYFRDEVTADALLNAIQQAGIKAELPPPHECDEKKK